MAQYTCDPTLQPGDTVLAAERRTAGPAYAWAPGGDADAYVKFVGPEHLAVVDGDVYARMGNGALMPHAALKEAHIVVRPVGGHPVYLTPHQFTTEWAAIAATDPTSDTAAELAAALDVIELLQTELAEARADAENAGPVVPPAADAGQAGVEAAGPAPAPAAPKRGRPVGSTNKPKDA